MFVIESICNWNVLFVPAIISSLRSSKQENGDSSGVEGVENSVGPTPVLDAELPHVAVPGSGDIAGLWKTELGTSLLQEPNNDIDGILFFSIECSPPPSELIRILYVPCHEQICSTGYMQSRV